MKKNNIASIYEDYEPLENLFWSMEQLYRRDMELNKWENIVNEAEKVYGFKYRNFKSLYKLLKFCGKFTNKEIPPNEEFFNRYVFVSNCPYHKGNTRISNVGIIGINKGMAVAHEGNTLIAKVGIHNRPVATHEGIAVAHTDSWDFANSRFTDACKSPDRPNKASKKKSLIKLMRTHRDVFESADPAVKEAMEEAYTLAYRK